MRNAVYTSENRAHDSVPAELESFTATDPSLSTALITEKSYVSLPYYRTSFCSFKLLETIKYAKIYKCLELFQNLYTSVKTPTFAPK